MRRILVAITVFAAANLTSAANPDKTWWAFRQLNSPPIPAVAEDCADWPRNPIDCFILKELTARGLTPAPQADRKSLIRRVYLDLIGLPPTYAEIERFVADKRSDAFERVVDELLASPHYGERWARHWMDVAHYAETHGHDQDRVRPHAWRYRDYLVRAFNEDRPYSRFIREQIAADVLFPSESDRLPALGFLAAGPWDESSLRDIRDDSIDRQVGYYLDRDDMVTTAITAFQSLTVHCARCHDHKFDPIAQEDYYALQAVFAGSGRGNLVFDADPQVRARRKTLTDLLTKLDARDPALLASAESDASRKELAEWEQKLKVKSTQWSAVESPELTAVSGSLLKPLPDFSVRSEGKRPETDTYQIVFRTKGSKLTGLRLEVLPDETLPHKGPGRQDNGNLHLNEIRVQVRRVGTAEWQPVPIRAAVADYDQPGWTIQHAIDGNPGTAWGIYPEVGKPHEGRFAFKQPISNDESEIRVELQQTHGGGHLIGRFRLSTTDAADPATGEALSAALSALLKIPAEKRTPQQWREIGLIRLREKTKAELLTLPEAQKVFAVCKDFETDASHKPVAMPREVFMLKRGDIRKPLEKAVPGTLSCLPNLPSRFEGKSSDAERRAALADWLARKDNPLTWRSIANRVWHYHFGKGIVDSPNDFGKMGGKPSHPELLDWLAVQFRDGGGSFKDLHRLIVTSATYQQSSRHDATAAAIDGDNRLLWRMNRSRLDAEQVRDSVLQISGRLSDKMGGPSDQQFAMRPGIHVTPVVEYAKFDWNRPEGHRRGVYRFVFRTLPDHTIDCLDGADASQWTPARNSSVTALQSLTLWNGEFFLVHAQALAEKLAKESREPADQVAAACRAVWGREPTASELPAFRRYAEKHGLAGFCRLLLNANEFLFVD